MPKIPNAMDTEMSKSPSVASGVDIPCTMASCGGAAQGPSKSDASMIVYIANYAKSKVVLV